MKNIQLITTQIETAKKIKKEYENENLKEAFEKIKNNEKYSIWFLVKNINLILALIESDDYIVEYYDDNVEGFKPTEIYIGNVKINSIDGIYDSITYCVLSNNSDEDVQVLTSEDVVGDEYTGSVEWRVKKDFKDILDFYLEFDYKAMVYEKCSKCKFLIVCNHDCKLKEGD